MYKPGGYFIRNPDLVPVYLHPGMWGWVLHRITGLLIVFYLLLHIWVIGRAAVSPQSFDAIMQTLSGPFWRVLGVGLLACVPLTTPIGGGFKRVTVTLRKRFDMFACVRPFRVFRVSNALSQG